MFSEIRGEKKPPTVQERAVRALGGLPAPLGAECLLCWCHSDPVAQLMPTLVSSTYTYIQKTEKIFSLAKLFLPFFPFPVISFSAIHNLVLRDFLL